jgi:hypothetical protein
VVGPVGDHTTLEWHGDIVTELPPGAVRLASSEKARNQVEILDGIHYLFQCDGQAAMPSMVRNWIKCDGEWATSGTNVKAGSLLREAVQHEGYFRNTYLRIFGNFLSLALPSSEEGLSAGSA